jgi:hypothetical protein
MKTVMKTTRPLLSRIALAVSGLAIAASLQAEETRLYWGDTHLHTNISPDAFVFGNTTATPDHAYQFAKGAPVIDVKSRAKIRIDTPLDFLVVADHAELMGLTLWLWSGDERVANTETGKHYIKMIKEGKGRQVFQELVRMVNTNQPAPDLNKPELRRSIWNSTINAAERANEPGKFTAFIGWEWSSTPQGKNLHRVVFTPQGKETAQKFLPFSAFDSDVESDFWNWLDKTSRETGADFVAIPHNSNISTGAMFPLTYRSGKPIDAAYARHRMRWEQVYETTQIKGDSETHPALSPEDAFANFETYEHLIKTDDSGLGLGSDWRIGSYTRSGLKRGLEFEEKIGANPFKYGLIGSTDSHSGYSTVEEDNFWGKMSMDSIPENKQDKQLAPGAYGWDMSASGLRPSRMPSSGVRCMPPVVRGSRCVFLVAGNLMVGMPPVKGLPRWDTARVFPWGETWLRRLQKRPPAS